MESVDKNQIKPLSEEDFAPCMTCGSVQCTICSDRLRELFAELQRRKVVRHFNAGATMTFLRFRDIEELFAPLIEKEEKK